ncbi:MAG: hypothetical protein CMM73_04190 [Rhodospirillaceae bacterium]|nr:hypothetical protein [Rhodospirillaceae bacterium]
MTIAEFVASRNRSKKLFTAGPASLLPENITGLIPCFGRGDEEYLSIENDVLNHLLKMSGHHNIARMQGSGSLALEIMARNFLHGRVLIISTGYYSDRLSQLAKSSAKLNKAIQTVDSLDWKELDDIKEKYDWVWACPTETSVGLKLPIPTLAEFANRCGARLMLDATASIGLEEDHYLADVISYSSCKGLFGLTGACFIAFNDDPTQKVDSFYLDINSHLEKKMTGPYHTIASLHDVLPIHENIKQSVVRNKNYFLRNMANYLTIEAEKQPLLCTHVDCEIRSDDSSVILYKARNNLGGSIVCHIGEAHLGSNSEAEIQSSLIY